VIAWSANIKNLPLSPVKTNRIAKKSRIFNDPLYGFVSLPEGIISDLIDHPWFQRLRRIKQLGMTNLVYPGALHTRFHHALGAMHLMREVVESLRNKGVEISDKEKEAVTIAILLHDIGHGPFSHALEKSIVDGISHEDLSALFMDRLNYEYKGALSLALSIFRDEYSRKFLHQLVSSQLDMDRLDYLLRDSFFTGVSEGVISSDRIVKMLHVVNDELVVEEKGLYSIEKFLISRRLMYWQVYLHKTVLSAENMLVKILARAKELCAKGEDLFATPALDLFLKNKFSKKDFQKKKVLLEEFAKLDDHDVIASIKVLSDHPDPVLSKLCSWLLDRKLLKTDLQNKPFDERFIKKQQEDAVGSHKIDKKNIKWFVFSDHVTNETYGSDKIRINILMKDGSLIDITRASDQGYLGGIQGVVKKYFLCYPKA